MIRRSFLGSLAALFATPLAMTRKPVQPVDPMRSAYIYRRAVGGGQPVWEYIPPADAQKIRLGLCGQYVEFGPHGGCIIAQADAEGRVAHYSIGNITEITPIRGVC